MREVEKMLLTYSYSSPREYADFGRLYPYHRFDGYSSKGEMKAWKMIELENDYIKLWVAPDIEEKFGALLIKRQERSFCIIIMLSSFVMYLHEDRGHQEDWK